MHEAVVEFKKRLLERYGERLVRFIVFGSYARGEQTAESDIDVFVTLRGEVDWRTEMNVFDIAYDVDLECDVLFDVKVFSEEDICDTAIGDSPFVKNVFKEGIAA